MSDGVIKPKRRYSEKCSLIDIECPYCHEETKHIALPEDFFGGETLDVGCRTVGCGGRFNIFWTCTHGDDIEYYNYKAGIMEKDELIKKLEDAKGRWPKEWEEMINMDEAYDAWDKAFDKAIKIIQKEKES